MLSLLMRLFTRHYLVPSCPMLFMLLAGTTRLSSSSFITPSRATSHLSRAMSTTTTTTRSSKASKASLGDGMEVSVQDAISLHGQDNVAFLDGSWFLPNVDTTARQNFEKGPRIAGARFFDIDDIATKHHPKNLPHMMPSNKLFEATMDALKITNEDNIIVYGQENCPYVHRAWFQLWAMGHAMGQIFVLDGSFKDWQEAGGPVEDQSTTVSLVADDLDLTKPTTYQATNRAVVDFEEMKQVVAGLSSSSSSDSQTKNIVVDVRARERFWGQVDEPRPGLRLGHMPGAKNLPFMDLLEPDNNNKLKPIAELKELLKQADIDYTDESRRIITSCGSGATACTLAAALIKCGRDPSTLAIYDGSWIEWGADPDVPITKDEVKESSEQMAKKQKTDS